MGLLSLVARLTLNASGFEQGLKRSQSLASRWSRDVSSNVKAQLAAAFGTGAMLAAAKNAVDYAGKINDLSARLGVSTEALQEFDYAGQQSGATIENFTSVMEKLSKSRAAAIGDPNGSMAQQFEKLGVSAEMLRNSRVDELLKQIGASFKATQDPQGLMAASLETMGKSSGTILPAMIAGLDDAAASAHNLGVVIEDGMIEKLDRVGDQLVDLQLQFRAIAANGAGGLLTVLNRIVQGTDYWINRVAGYIAGFANFSDKETIRQLSEDMGNEAAAAQVEREQEIVRMRDYQRKAARLTSDFSDTAIDKESGKDSKASIIRAEVTSRQRIGAFIAATPLISEQRRSNQLLGKIERNTRDRRLAGSSDPLS